MRASRLTFVGVPLVFAFLVALATAEQKPEGVKNAQSPNMGVWRADEIVGTTVKNAAGQDLGKIEDLVIDMTTGKVRYAAVSFGGFLGVGDKLFAVPFSAMKMKHNANNDTRHFEMNVSKQTLEKAPGFDKKNWPDFANPQWGAANDKFYLDGTTAKP